MPETVTTTRPHRTPVPGPRADATGARLRVLLSMLSLGVLAPFTLTDWTDDVATPLNAALALVIVLISAARLSGVLGSGRSDPFRAFFYVFVFVFLGVASLAQVTAGHFPQDGTSYSPATQTLGLTTLLLGIVGYEFGWLLLSRRRPAAAEGPARDSRLCFSPARTVLVALFGLGAVAYQVTADGIATFFVSRSQTTTLLAGVGDGGTPFYTVADKTAGLLTTFLSQVPVFVALFVILYCRHHRVWDIRRGLVADFGWRILIGLLIGANVVINNPIGNGRFWAFLVIVAIASVYLRYDQPSGMRWFVAMALIILLFAFTALDAFRNSGTAEIDVQSPQTSLVTDPSYSAFQMELNGVEYVEAHGHTDGLQMLGNLLAFVPRSVWEAKPTATGQLIDPQYVRSASAWTEFEVDFGLAGVFVLFTLYGAGSAALTRRSAGARFGVLHAVVPVLAVFQLFLLRGSLLPAVSNLYQLVAVLLLVLGVRRARTQLHRRPSTASTTAIEGAR